MTLVQMTLVQMTLVQMTLVQMTLVQMIFEQMTFVPMIFSTIDEIFQIIRIRQKMEYEIRNSNVTLPKGLKEREQRLTKCQQSRTLCVISAPANKLECFYYFANIFSILTFF